MINIDDAGNVAVSFSKAFALAANEFQCTIPGPVSLYCLFADGGPFGARGLLELVFDRDTGLVASPVLITVNGRSVKSEDPRAVTVSPGDKVFIMPALTGG